MNNKDYITLNKGVNAIVRAWYLKNLGRNPNLRMPSLNNAVVVPYVKAEQKGEGMKL